MLENVSEKQVKIKCLTVNDITIDRENLLVIDPSSVKIDVEIEIFEHKKINYIYQNENYVFDGIFKDSSPYSGKMFDESDELYFEGKFKNETFFKGKGTLKYYNNKNEIYKGDIDGFVPQGSGKMLGSENNIIWEGVNHFFIILKIFFEHNNFIFSKIWYMGKEFSGNGTCEIQDRNGILYLYTGNKK